MSDENLFRTGRMNVMRGANLMFMPGEFIYLQRDVQEFKRGTPVKVISVQAVRPGEYRYQILIDDKKTWAFESDLSHTVPRDPQVAPQNVASSTQRLQTMTLSQRMTSIATGPSGPNPAGAPPRMHNSTQAERMQRMLQTNRMRTLGVTADDPALQPASPETAANPTSTVAPAPALAPAAASAAPARVTTPPKNI